MLSLLALQCKQADNDRYLCTLFAPETKREGLFALYAFNQELARIRENIKEPMMGFIRLAWWREAVSELYEDKTRNHDVLNALHAVCKESELSYSLFERMIDGREVDMEENPPATLKELEDYAIRTSSSLFSLALEMLGVNDKAAHQAAHHVGIAWMLIGYMRAIRFYASTNRVLLPQENLDREGITAADVIAGRLLEKTVPILRELTDRAEFHLQEARKLRPLIPKEASPALLPAVIAEVFIRRIRQSGYAVFGQDLEGNRFTIQLKLLFVGWQRGF